MVRKTETDAVYEYQHLMPETAVGKISLFKGGFLYLATHTDDSGNDAGWMSIDNRQKILVADHGTAIEEQPQITDVVLDGDYFWIGTREHGVLRYDTRARKVTQANRTETGNESVTNVCKLGRHRGGIILLAGKSLYRWSGDNDEWKSMRKDVADFGIDSSNDRLWLRPSEGGLIEMRGTKEIDWFTGNGPANLDPASANGIFISTGEGHEAQFMFKADAIQDRTLYPYNLKKDSWGEVRTIPGTHPVDMFALLDEHIFTVDEKGGYLYR